MKKETHSQTIIWHNAKTETPPASGHYLVLMLYRGPGDFCTGFISDMHYSARHAAWGAIDELELEGMPTVAIHAWAEYPQWRELYDNFA